MLWFLAHPVRAYETRTVADNLRSGREYMRAFVAHGINVAAPWILLCEILDDTIPEQRQRGMEVCAQVLIRCDGIVLCGDRISDGMLAEFELADINDLYVANCIGLDSHDAARRLARHTERAVRPKWINEEEDE